MKVTLTELRESSDRYFRRHLAREEWNSLSEEIKQSALSEAEADIALYLDSVEVDTDDSLALKALFEQALHLARLARRPPPGGRRLVAESVTGIGSRNWEYPDEPEEPEYAPRALRFLETLLHRNFRLGRG